MVYLIIEYLQNKSYMIYNLVIVLELLNLKLKNLVYLMILYCQVDILVLVKMEYIQNIFDLKKGD